MQTLARWFAVVGGVVIGLLAILTVISVIGRVVLQAPIRGDIEIAQFLMAFAISCFLPWCQWQRSHVVIEFFTQHVSRRLQVKLQQLGDGLMGIIAGIFAWRTALAAISALPTNEGSMLLGIPTWLNYAVLVPGFGVMAVIGLWSAVRGRP